MNNINKVIILIWTKSSSKFLTNLLENFAHLNPNCNNTCHFTTDRSLLSISKIVIFHGMSIDMQHLPKARHSQQIYVFFAHESPGRTGHAYKKLPENFFNITMTYRKDSDIFVPFDRFESIGENDTGVKEIWSERLIQEKVVQKSKLLLSFDSPCTNDQKSIVAELKKHINISEYGSCNRKNCDIPCVAQEIDSHYFILAFEDSICKDYITEKFWTLKKLIVPIVLSRKTYQNFAPHHAFIAVDDFISIQDLAEYLKNLVLDKGEYLTYFRWTKIYKKTIVPSTTTKCTLCSLATMHRKSRVTNMTQWWHEDSKCEL